MKVKRLFALVLALAMVMGTMFVPAFAEETTDRTITMTASKDEVSTGETFTITVSVASDLELKFASWDLDYDETYFTLVGAELVAPYVEEVSDHKVDKQVLLMYRNNNLLTPDVYAVPGDDTTSINTLTGDLMIYTFTAKQQPVNDWEFEFTSSNVRTGDDGWTGVDVTDKIEEKETDVTILYREFAITELYDGVATTPVSTYDNAEHTFSVTAELEEDDPDENPATITYLTDGGSSWSQEAPTFTKAGTYSVSYKVERAGYLTVENDVQVVINPAAFEDVTIGFTTETETGTETEDITAEIEDGTYEFKYDGTPHKLVVDEVNTIDGSDITITYSYGNGAASPEPPAITDAGTHEITYIIEAPNHETIKKTITITIEDPEKVVEVLFGEQNDYTDDNKMVLVYTNAKNVSFTYDNAQEIEQMYDVSGGKYEYVDRDGNKVKYDYVYALVVEALSETGDYDTDIKTYEDRIGVNYQSVDSSYIIDYNKPYDINGVDPVDYNDIISAYSVLANDPAPMHGIIKLDTDFSKTANTMDVVPIIGEVYR